MGQFRRYMHVERLGTEDCEGLLENSQVYITAKVDGSNGCVWWDDASGALSCGSRNFELSDSQDNAHFYAWCNAGGEEQVLLASFCEQHPSLVVYGEWMGRDRFVGAFKNYDPDAKARLIIFDVFDREADAYLPDAEWRPLLAQAGLEPWFVKVLAVLDHPSMDDVLAVAKRNDFLLEGTGLVGEGVVCKVAGWRNRFGRQVYGKVVLDEFKTQRKPRRGAETNVEQEIIDFYMTDSELDKTMAKVCARCDASTFEPGNRKMMGMLGSMCWNDLLVECPKWVKRFKKPCVDFGKLSGLCRTRISQHVEGNA